MEQGGNIYKGPVSKSRVKSQLNTNQQNEENKDVNSK